MPLAIVIDPRSAVPLHRQIYDAWRSGILSGRFRRGERAPSTRELAQALAVSRSTVTQAYEQLIAEGYLQATHGAGTFVCRELPEELLRPSPVPQPRTVATPAIRLSNFGARLQEDFTYLPRPSGFICFTRWGPDPDHFPFALWRKLMTRHLRKPAAAIFDYAEQSHGYAPLREEIAAYLARAR